MPAAHDAAIEHGLEVLFEKCLCLSANDELVVVYDEQFVPFLDALATVVLRCDWNVTRLFLPRGDQVQLVNRARASRDPSSVSLPRAFQEALLSSTAILNVLGGSQETSIVRGSVIDCPRSGDSRFAHVPGIDRDVLAVLSVSPIDEICEAAEALAWALGEARNVDVITTDRTGAKHSLSMNLEGWTNEPMMSPGVILPGSWGNVPPGETFCCPDPGTVQGSICINGSVPDCRMEPGEEIVLWFDQGKLTYWEGHATASAFFEREKARATRTRDEHWNTFAEFGIGLNRAISRLTGNSLYDEKAAGTAHIAIGANDSFGHSIRAAIHADLVTREPTIRLDGHDVMADGSLLLEQLGARREALSCPSVRFRSDAKVFLRESRVDIGEGGLKRVLAKARRVGHVTLGPGRLQSALKQAAACLQDYHGDVKVSDFLGRYPRFDDVDSTELLAVLDHYNVLGFTY